MDFLFFIKTVIASIILVGVLQIKVGETTMENHATQWIRSSAITQPLHTVADGGVRIVRDSVRWVSTQVQRQTGKFFGSKGGSPGERHLGLKLERSQVVEQIKEQQSAIKKVTDSVESE